MKAYQEVMKTTRNKREVTLFNCYRCVYISRIFYCLKNKNYVPCPLRKVTIYEPKERLIVVQNFFDKIINHLVSREILIPYFPILLGVLLMAM